MEKTFSFESHCKFVKDVMGETEYHGKGGSEVDEILKNRIKKFYATNDFIQVDVEHFKQRIQPLYAAGIEPSDDTLVLFGIDFMRKQQLRQYFADFQPEIIIIDESNCMLTFSSAVLALTAVKALVKPDSSTRFKVEEDPDDDVLAEFNLNLGQKASPHPKEWIELRPYIYHYKKNKYVTKQYQRKLYIRFATAKEKQAGFDKMSFIDGLISKCKLIWQNQAKKDENLRLFLERKMLRLNETRKLISEQKQKSTTSENRSEGHHRSRSREMKPGNKGQSPMPSQRNPNDPGKKTNAMMQGMDQDLSYEIRSRSQVSNYNLLIEEFQNLEFQTQDRNVSILRNTNMQKGKDNTGMSGAPEIAYRLLQPSQLRMEIKNEKFNYKKYILESIEKEEKIQPVSFIDLSQDD